MKKIYFIIVLLAVMAPLVFSSNGSIDVNSEIRKEIKKYLSDYWCDKTKEKEEWGNAEIALNKDMSKSDVITFKRIIKEKKLNINLENCITATVKKKPSGDEKLQLGGGNFCFLIDKETHKVLLFYRER